MSAEAALSDVKILDLMWVIAGPAATRVLADYGATVVRVESTKSLDSTRVAPPFHNGQPGPESSGPFQNMNAGKLGITLDLERPQGRAIFLDLVRWADVVTESFSGDTMAKWGLGYQALVQVNPDIIMLSTSLMGQSGPLAGYSGYGNQAAAITGFFHLASWPDRAPAGPFAAYTDAIVPWFVVAAILAALEHHRRTGEGQFIDLAQAEAALHFLGPALLDYTANGRVARPQGNRDPQMAPHGVYLSGDDEWVAIAVADDPQWGRFCIALDRPELAMDGRFDSLPQRLVNTDVLDAIVSAWTSTRDAEGIQLSLQGTGVPAHIVQNSARLTRDPQLIHRGHFVELDHPIHGTTTVEGSRFRLSATPAQIDRCGPTFGRDNSPVLRDILGYSEETMAEIAAAEVLE